MKRARDIRDQLAGLLERVEIELTSDANDLDAIKKSITSSKLIRLIISCNADLFYYTESNFNCCRVFPTLCTAAKEWIISNC